MKISTKLITQLLISVLVCSTLTSCNNDKNTSAQQQGTPQNPYTIIWYMIGTPQPDSDMVMNKLNEYLIPKIGAKVEFHQIDWPNYDQKMKMLTMTGQNYDIAFTASWSNDYFLQASRGAFYPLNELLDKYGAGIKANVDPRFLDGAKINGTLYAIPTNKEIGRQLVYRINQNWLKQTGLKMEQFKPYAELETLQSIEPFMQAVKAKLPDVIPYAVFRNTTYAMGNMETIANSEMPGAILFADKQLKVFNQYEDPQFIKYFIEYHKMYQKGLIPADAAQIDDNPSLQVSGKWAVGNAEYQPFADNLWTMSSGYPIKSVPAYKPVITSNTVTGAMMAISINAKRPDIDMKFLDLINSDPYVRNLIQNGIESIHYVRIAKNRIKYLPRRSEKYNMPGFALGNLFITYLLDGDPEDKWQQFANWNKSAIPAPTLGFNFNITPIAPTYAAVSTVIKKYRGGLYTGQNDPQVYLPLMNKELKEAGLDKLLAEEQRQLDEWRKKVGK
jgi:putative aldouronate transport system substrate-binding protein